MVLSCCCVPFCKSGYPSTRKKNKEDNVPNTPLFSMPKMKEMFQIWERKIDRKDRRLTSKDKVCALHFQKEFIESNYPDLTMPDGSVFQMKKGKPTLKEDAVPSIFPCYPKYKSKPIPPARKPPKRRCTASDLNHPNPKRSRHFVTDDATVHSTSDATNGHTTPFEADEELIHSTDPVYEHFINILHSKSPENWEVHVSEDMGCIFLFQMDPSDFQLKKRVIITKARSVKVFVGNISITMNETTLDKEEDLLNLLEHVHNMQACPGSSPTCQGFLPIRSKKCVHCYRFDRRLYDGDKCIVLRKKKEFFRRKYLKLLQKQNVRNYPKRSLDAAIEALPVEQKECIQAMLNASKFQRGTSSAKGVRYTRAWMYQCILLKIRNYKLYRDLRFNKIMPLPSKSTIHKYIRKLTPSFGFQKPLFNVLKEKASKMPKEARRGAILLDEMKISPRASFDRSKMEVTGFTDLGKYTPREQSDKLGDHVLVLMFQPFQGQWVQAMGSFLSRGCATGDVLAQIVLEAIAMLENSEIFVDCIVSDGATWNRGMWSKYGVNESNPSCEHVADASRKLYFVSDFPHLIKNVWTWVLRQKEIETPDGVIRKSHWEAVIKIDAGKAIKCCPELNSSHVSPKQYEKMSVARAYQFFSFRTASAINFYRTNGGHPELTDSESTEKFILRIANLIHAFDSRTGKSAIRKYETPERQAIQEFRTYLDKCCESPKNPISVPRKKKNIASENDVTLPLSKEENVNVASKTKLTSSTSKKTSISKKKKKENNSDVDIPEDIIITPEGSLAYVPQTSVKTVPLRCNRIASDSTIAGLRVTCQVALELSDFLLNTCGYSFVMLTRLNQDNLEKFFGMVRSCGGCNDHPDPAAFLLIFRLMSMYSLIKPTGSNVTGEELFDSLLKDCDTSCVNEKLEKWKELRRRIVTHFDANFSPEGDIEETLTINRSEEDQNLLQFFGGYIAMKAISFIHCETCAVSLIDDNVDNTGRSLIDVRNYHKVLHYPSKSLFKLLSLFENIVENEISCSNISTLSPDTFFNLIEKLTISPTLSDTIGCSEHRLDLLSYVVQFFLILRMQFICKEYNACIKDVKKPREMRKMGKLIQGCE